MADSSTSSPVEVTIVHAPACHFCADADEVLTGLTKIYPLSIERIDIRTANGQELQRIHRPAMSPLVLVDGEFFSSGRLPRKKLARLLDQRIIAATQAG